MHSRYKLLVAIKSGVFAAAVSTALVSSASADSFRPGASPAGGRIGKLCGHELFDSAFRNDCFARMKAAKTNAEREEVRALVKTKTKELEILREEMIKSDPGLADRAVHEVQTQR